MTIWIEQDKGRADLQRERDRQDGIKTDNFYGEQTDCFNRIVVHEWGGKDQDPISDLIRKLIKKGGESALIEKQKFFWDYDLLADIMDQVVLEGIIPDGWECPLASQEEININSIDDGSEYEIFVELFKPEYNEANYD